MSIKRIEADPTDLGSLVSIIFPQALRSIQSFLGSLNYYSQFIEDFAIYASVLYKLMEAVFHEIRRSHSKEVEGSPSNDHGHNTQIDDDSGQRPASDHDHPLVTTNNQASVKVKESYKEHTGAHRWGKAMIAFTMLKAEVAQTSVPRHLTRITDQ